MTIGEQLLDGQLEEVKIGVIKVLESQISEAIKNMSEAEAKKYKKEIIFPYLDALMAMIKESMNTINLIEKTKTVEEFHAIEWPY